MVAEPATARIEAGEGTLVEVGTVIDVSCNKMKSDDYRYFAESSTSGAESEAAEDARVAYAEAWKITGRLGLALKERIQERIVEETADVPSPQIDGLQRCTGDDVSVSERIEEQVGVFVPEIVEQIIGVPVSQMMEEIIKVLEHISEEKEQAQNCAVEHIVDVPVPQSKNDVPIAQWSKSLRYQLHGFRENWRGHPAHSARKNFRSCRRANRRLSRR